MKVIQASTHTRLAWAAGDALIFADEQFLYRWTGGVGIKPYVLGAGHKEARISEISDAGNPTARFIIAQLRKVIIHQFHNTSSQARMRQKWRSNESRWLKEDAGNLAPFLLRLSEEHLQYYSRIRETIKLALPFFADFALTPDSYGNVLLQWREKGTDCLFDASQASDGMLRFIALVALLQQPEKDLPNVLILDEPELGLHPSAIQIVSDLVKSASKTIQVIVATQSVSLVDRFDAEDIVVVNREGRQTQLKRLSEPDLRDWLQEYTLSELWEKNILGGRPA